MIDIGVARPRAQGQAMIRTATALTSPKPMAGAGPGLAGATRRRLSERQVQGLEALFALRAIAQQVDDVPTGCGHGGSNPNPVRRDRPLRRTSEAADCRSDPFRPTGRSTAKGSCDRTTGAVVRGTESLLTCMGVFLSSGFLVCCRFLVWSGKAVPRPVACDQVRGARGKVSRDRNASAA